MSKRTQMTVFVGIVVAVWVFLQVAVPRTSSAHAPVSIATQDAVLSALAAQAKATATIRFGPAENLTVSANLEDVAVSVTNADTVAHTLTPQADFYRVPAAQVSQDDPASAEVTAGYIALSLAPGETETVTIHAKNFNHDPVKSASFRATSVK